MQYYCLVRGCNYNGALQCQCDDACVDYGDCCPDHTGVCVDGGGGGEPTTPAGNGGGGDGTVSGERERVCVYECVHECV